MNLTLGNFLSSFMSCNDDFKNMKIAWELHHEIKNSKNSYSLVFYISLCTAASEKSFVKCMNITWILHSTLHNDAFFQNFFSTHWLRTKYYTKNGFEQWILHKINILRPWQLKKSKCWEPFWSYQLNSTADLANLAQFWGKWAGLAVLFSW